MVRKLSPMRGNPLYLIMGKSQNALWLTGWMNGKQGFGEATSIWLFPWKKPKSPLAHGMDERQTGFWGGNLNMAFSLEDRAARFFTWMLISGNAKRRADGCSRGEEGRNPKRQGGRGI